MKTIFFLLLIKGAIAGTAYGEKMMLDENYELVPYLDYSKRDDLDRDRPAEFYGSAFFSDDVQRGEIGVRFTMGTSPWSQIKSAYKDLVGVDYQPDYSFAMAQVDGELPSGDSHEDVQSVLEDTEDKNAVMALADKITLKGTVLTILGGAGSYFIYDEWIKDDSDSEDEPDSGIRLREGDVFVSDTVATDREVRVELGSSGSSSVEIYTFDSSRDEGIE